MLFVVSLLLLCVYSKAIGVSVFENKECFGSNAFINNNTRFLVGSVDECLMMCINAKDDCVGFNYVKEGKHSFSTGACYFRKTISTSSIKNNDFRDCYFKKGVLNLPAKISKSVHFKCEQNSKDYNKDIDESLQGPLEINCPKNQVVEILKDSYYGRKVDYNTFCNYNTKIRPDLNCKTKFGNVMNLTCNGKNACTINPTNTFFNKDPCEKTYKYLKIGYKCTPKYKCFSKKQKKIRGLTFDNCKSLCNSSNNCKAFKQKKFCTLYFNNVKIKKSKKQKCFKIKN